MDRLTFFLTLSLSFSPGVQQHAGRIVSSFLEKAPSLSPPAQHMTVLVPQVCVQRG